MKVKRRIRTVLGGIKRFFLSAHTMHRLSRTISRYRCFFVATRSLRALGNGGTGHHPGCCSGAAYPVLVGLDRRRQHQQIVWCSPRPPLPRPSSCLPGYIRDHQQPTPIHRRVRLPERRILRRAVCGGRQVIVISFHLFRVLRTNLFLLASYLPSPARPRGRLSFSLLFVCNRSRCGQYSCVLCLYRAFASSVIAVVILSFLAIAWRCCFVVFRTLF